MRCDEFRRKLLEDPRRSEAEFLAHRASCKPCDRAARVVEGLEGDLEKLLRFAPPPDLGERLRLPRRRAWRPLGLAASLAGLLVLGVWWWQPSPPGGTAAVIAEVMHHIDHEPEAFASRIDLTPDRYRDLSPAVSISTGGWARVVSYAAPCDILERPGLHLVLRGAAGPVTVLVITGVRVARQELIHAEGMQAVMRPVRGGSLAVVGQPGSALEAIAAEIASRLRIRA